MSGGVDSSVAALLLKRQGYDIVGVFMRCWGGNGPDALVGASCAETDAEDARRVAGKLDIPFYVWDMEEEYKKRVVEYMVEGYRQGLTPNPDVMCNKEIKFGLFFDRARGMGADYIATGHYVRCMEIPTREAVGTPTRSVGAGHYVHLKANRIKKKELRIEDEPSFIIHNSLFSLFAARDTKKDQSYFLWTLTQRELRHCLFPIGGYLKSNVRAIAKRVGLPTADKKDSQGICFLGKIALADFLKAYIPETRGVVYATTGERVGEHDGAHFYTIGQRHGLNLGSKNYELRIKGRIETKAHYVAEKDIRTNTITVAEGSNHPVLYKKEVTLTGVNFVNPSIILNSKFVIPVLARVRYRQPLVKARITNCEEEIKNKNQPLIRNSKFLILKFDQPVKFVAPGQSAVFYTASGKLIGGGVIAA